MMMMWWWPACSRSLAGWLRAGWLIPTPPPTPGGWICSPWPGWLVDRGPRVPVALVMCSGVGIGARHEWRYRKKDNILYIIILYVCVFFSEFGKWRLFFVDWEPSILTHLQVRVVKLGRCPYCHEKSLVSHKLLRAGSTVEVRVYQCTECARVFVL